MAPPGYRYLTKIKISIYCIPILSTVSIKIIWDTFHNYKPAPPQLHAITKTKKQRKKNPPPIPQNTLFFKDGTFLLDFRCVCNCVSAYTELRP